MRLLRCRCNYHLKVFEHIGNENDNLVLNFKTVSLIDRVYGTYESGVEFILDSSDNETFNPVTIHVFYRSPDLIQ